MKEQVAKNVHRDFLQDTIVEYVEDRIDELHVSLETIHPDSLLEVQGRVKELRYLLRAKQYAKDVLEKAKKG